MAASSGLLEPRGVLLGVGLLNVLAVVYPIMLSLAGSSMLCVIYCEVIPDTHCNGHQTSTTIGLMAGFSLMMDLSTTVR